MSAVLREGELAAGSATARAAPPQELPQDRPLVDPASLPPAERLARSRARLRAALLEIAHPPPKASAFDAFGGLKGQLLDLARSIPGAGLVLETLQTWWRQHPLHAAGVLAEEASRSFVVPLARRNPLGLIVGAVLVGAVLALSRPWKWLLRPALFIGIVPQLVAQALKRLPIDSWMQMLDSILPRSAAAAAAKAEQRASDLPGAP